MILKPQSEQITLLKDYISTLERQNKAKNQQRQILYIQIDHLKNDHARILTCLSQKEQNLRQNLKYQEAMQNHIDELERRIACYDMENQEKQNFFDQIQQKYHQLQSINQELNQKLNCKNETEQNFLSEIQVLNEEIDTLHKQLQQKQVSSHNSVNISELIENYEKIENLSKSRERQNQQLKVENSRLQQIIHQLKEAIHRKPQSNRNQHGRNGSEGNVSFPQTQYLIIQNNQLIERITALQKQKNILYAQLTGKQWIKEMQGEKAFLSNSTNHYLNISPLKSGSSNKLQNRIETLRTENESLLQSLRLD